MPSTNRSYLFTSGTSRSTYCCQCPVSVKRCFESCFNVNQYSSLYSFWQNHLEGRLAPNWPPDFCHLGAETCAAPWCPCPHGSLLIGGGMPAVPLSGLPGSAVPTEEAPGLSCRHPEPETKRPQKSGNSLLGNPCFGCMDEIFHQHSLPGKYWFRSFRYLSRDYV